MVARADVLRSFRTVIENDNEMVDLVGALLGRSRTASFHEGLSMAVSQTATEMLVGTRNSPEGVYHGVE